ncbi:MAG: hypothetical protein IKU44_04060 [Firmicutes bacterium]|nr:hypothetical protein [Bacillota bacterium]
MDNFIAQMELEKKRLEKQVDYAQKVITLSPEGTLSIRQRKRGITYYRNTFVIKNAKKKKVQTNITWDRKLVRQLTEKLVQRKILRRAQSNLFYLNKLIERYQSTTVDEMIRLLGNAYQEYYQERKDAYLKEQREKPYPKAPFNPKYHIHETDCGEMVRSKSEQIILNALTAYSQFVTHYEEEFLYREGVDGLERVFPDFTIILPNGKRIIWEHLGRLDDPEYCRRTALKLCLYQRNGYVVGDNLILTMDDYKGNVSSTLILRAVNQILAKI